MDPELFILDPDPTHVMTCYTKVLKYYIPESTGLKLEIKFYFICSIIPAVSGTNNSGSVKKFRI